MAMHQAQENNYSRNDKPTYDHLKRTIGSDTDYRKAVRELDRRYSWTPQEAPKQPK